MGLIRYSLDILKIHKTGRWFISAKGMLEMRWSGYNGGELTPFGTIPLLEVGSFWVSGFDLVEM